MRFKLIVQAFCLFFIQTVVLQAQAPDSVMHLPKWEGDFSLDGHIDEAGWRLVEPLPLVEYQPHYGDKVSSKTEIRVAYDQQFLYVSGKFFDDPGGIRATTLYRDQLGLSDHFHFAVDPFNDNENAKTFTTTPAGVRRDSEIKNDLEGFGGFNLNWNTFWEVQSRVTSYGWSTEMKIPLSSVGVQADNGTATIGMSAGRVIARNVERHVFPDVSPEVPFSFLRPSFFQDVKLTDIRPVKPLYVTPYILGGRQRSSNLDNSRANFIENRETVLEPGLDVRYNLANNLTMDLTVNTDFAQVETDAIQTNITRFSLFFPEKRRFFQEKSGNFSFNTGGVSRLFHSRRIGLDPDGNPVSIYGGARLSGRVGDWEIGILNMQTADSELLPSENMGILRMRKNVINEYSYIGGMSTTRIGSDGSKNIAYGLDGIIRLLPNHYLSYDWAQTFGDRISLNRDNYLGRISWENRLEEGFGYEVSTRLTGQNYIPGLGFIRRRGYLEFSGSAGYGWFPGGGSPVRINRVSGEITVYRNNVAEKLETVIVQPNYFLEFDNQASILFTGELRRENLVRGFDIGKIPIPADEYFFGEAEINGRTPGSNRLVGDLAFSLGSFFEGRKREGSFSIEWNASKYFQLNGEYRRIRIDFDEWNQSFDSDLFRLKIQTAVDIHLSVQAFLQFDSVSDQFSVNSRMRYNFEEGHDLYIVFNDNLNVERRRTGPEPDLPVINSRQLLIKYQYTLKQ